MDHTTHHKDDISQQLTEHSPTPQMEEKFQMRASRQGDNKGTTK
jgi:hypothetical protein